jgi:hypothetical protein
MAEVQSAGPLLCNVPLSKGLKDTKVLLPATTFERLVDTIQVPSVILCPFFFYLQRALIQFR